MNRRQFIGSAVALAAVGPSCMQKVIQTNPLGNRGGGKLVIFSPPNPAVQNGITITIPETYMFELVSIKGELATSAVAANRNFILTTGFAGDQLYNYSSSTALTASLFWFFQAVMISGNALNANNTVNMPLPPLFVPPRGLITSSFANLSAGDQISNFRVNWSLVHLKEPG